MNIMVLKMVWLQLLGFQFVLPILVYVVFGYNNFDFSNEALMHPVAISFISASILPFALAFMLPKLAKHKQHPQLHNTASTPRNNDAIKEAFTPYILRVALFEFCGMIGFIGSMINANPTFVVFGAMLSVIGMLQSNPTRELLEGLAGKRFAA